MADEIQNLIVDLSKPEGDPNRARYVPRTQAEIDRQPIEEQRAQVRQARKIRHNRNVLLAESDWTQFADSPLTDTKRAEWAEYRQQLRDWDMTREDFPDQPGRR